MFSQSEGIKFILFLIHSGIEVNFNMMHVKYDLIYHSIHFYRWDSLCYLTEVKKDYNQSTCVLYIYLKKMQNMNNFFPSKYWYW